MVNTKFTTLYQKEDKLYDTICLPVKPVYRLNVSSIKITDNCIDISMSEPPMLEDKNLLYRILLNVQLTTIVTIKKDADKTLQKAIEFLEGVNTKTIFINQKVYTGCIKIFMPFSEFRPGNVTISGFSKYVFYIKNGKLLKREKFPDVDIDEYYMMVRPT